MKGHPSLHASRGFSGQGWVRLDPTPTPPEKKMQEVNYCNYFGLMIKLGEIGIEHWNSSPSIKLERLKQTKLPTNYSYLRRKDFIYLFAKIKQIFTLKNYSNGLLF